MKITTSTNSRNANDEWRSIHIDDACPMGLIILEIEERDGEECLVQLTTQQADELIDALRVMVERRREK